MIFLKAVVVWLGFSVPQWSEAPQVSFRYFRWRISALGLTEVVEHRKGQIYRAKELFCLLNGFHYSRYALIHLILEYNFADCMNWKK